MHFLESINRARLAITGQTSPVAHSAPAGAPTRPAVTVPALTVRPEPGEGVAPRVVVARPGPAPLPEVAPLAELPAGPRRLLETLHRLAVDVLPTRGHALTPSQLVMHLSGELLAAALGAHRVTVWRWACYLKGLGLLDARPHKGTTMHRAEAVTRNTGTLYAVPLAPGHRPRLRYADLHHEWRDLESDRKAGNTAFSALQQSHPSEGGGWFEQLRNWAVTPGQTKPPVDSVDCCTGPASVQDVVYTLPLVAQAHPTKRAELVGILGAALARHLGDAHSRRWYCALIWAAWRDECEGRSGLQVLAAQLAHLGADLREGAPWRNPGAVLAARLA